MCFEALTHTFGSDWVSLASAAILLTASCELRAIWSATAAAAASSILARTRSLMSPLSRCPRAGRSGSLCGSTAFCSSSLDRDIHLSKHRSGTVTFCFSHALNSLLRNFLVNCILKSSALTDPIFQFSTLACCSGTSAATAEFHILLAALDRSPSIFEPAGIVTSSPSSLPSAPSSCAGVSGAFCSWGLLAVRYSNTLAVRRLRASLKDVSRSPAFCASVSVAS
mmetsp:Transcript_24899/g.41634  ORF Transcript_24899/g.41634 Transcript_24899/m.41634 type:complete len:224 (-) Transcript_24899:322-993(-)